MKEIFFASLALAAAAHAASLPADRDTVPRAELDAIVAGDEYPATTTFTKRIESIDFGLFEDMALRLWLSDFLPASYREAGLGQLVRDIHHYLFTQDAIEVAGTYWLRFIDSGYFD